MENVMPNTPASGSITIHYDGEQVTTQYTSGQPAAAVAYAIYSNINNHSQIQLTASVPETGKVLLTEKRDGCAYNGNSVAVTHTNGTHITVNNDTFFLTGGEDVQGCEDPVPPPPEDPGDPPPPIYISWGSVIDTPGQGYGWVHMWSYSWASEPIYYLDVIGVSQRDYLIINSGQDGGYNRSSAIVGVSEYRDPFDSVSSWIQNGDHLFGITANYGYNTTSSDWETF